MSFYYQKKHRYEDAADICKKHYKKEEVQCEIRLKEKCRGDKNKGKMAVDFEYFVADPNVFTGNAPVALPAAETTIAAISFNDVQRRSEILLQALVHIVAAAAGDTVILRIRKFENGTQMLPASGELIYETPPIVLELGANQVAALHVDNDFFECEERVTYLLTATPGEDDVLTLARPITFTGTEFN
ncbi:hypothetical protein [Sutcliffiella horikoshii]|uniref:hypothetical protein n=1 Tax=Sutcliffiella horikoshii TaxID=79883 RepID=UPI003CEDF3EA